jgi:hypothetical protein
VVVEVIEINHSGPESVGMVMELNDNSSGSVGDSDCHGNDFSGFFLSFHFLSFRPFPFFLLLCFKRGSRSDLILGQTKVSGDQELSSCLRPDPQTPQPQSFTVLPLASYSQ